MRYYPALMIFSQRNSPASEPGQRIFSVSPGTAGNRLDRWLSECLPAVSRARIQAVIRSAGASSGFEIARGLEDGPTEGFFSSAGRERW